MFSVQIEEANQILCVWIPTPLNMVDMYTKNVSQQLLEQHHHMVVCDNEDDDKECCKYLYEMLDMSHETVTNSPGEGVASG